jgi:hypothetical protein
MNKLPLLTVLNRALGDNYREPEVHFHATSYEDSPEVCYDSACRRPQLAA